MATRQRHGCLALGSWLLGPCIAVLAQSAVLPEASREQLVEPTYRVSKTTDSGRLSTGIDNTLVAEATEVPPRSGAPADASLSEARSPSVADTTATSLSEPEVVFAQVLADAQVMLQHIHDHVDDYTCMFVKRESVKGQISGPQYMVTKVRNRKVHNGQIVVPFSVYMRFVKPASYKGREVLYVEGRNDNKLLAKEGGTAGRIMPAVLLPVDGRFAMRDNLYPITEFGIENLTQRLLDRGGADRSIRDCVVTYRDGAKVCDRPCRMMEVRREVPKTGDAARYGMNVYLAHVFTDIELKVPIRYAAYSWPTSPGGPPVVVEEYTYQDMQLNVGLTDADFDPKNPEYGF